MTMTTHSHKIWTDNVGHARVAFGYKEEEALPSFVHAGRADREPYDGL
jgi:hypothetical protein